MSEVICFAALLGGLFVVATLLLSIDQWKWPKSPFMRSLLAVLLVAFELVAALWLGWRFMPSSYELISTTLACTHFAFLCFWCTCSRAPSGLRVILLFLVTAALFAIFNLPREWTHTDSYANANVSRSIYRLIVTALGAVVCGACCRLRGWRFENKERQPEERKSTHRATSVQSLMTGLLISLSVFAIVGVKRVVESQWTDTFQNDFSIVIFACFVAGLLLAGLAITACQFRFEWLGGIAVGFAILWSVVNMSSHYQSWTVMQLKPELWRQYLPWLLLSTSWWWLLFKHLGGTGYMLVHSDRSILVRPGLKHVLLSMVIVAFLLSGVKKRYFDQFDHLVRMEMLQSRGTVEPTQPFSAAANAQEPITGLIFNQLIPERVVKSISRLKTLHKIRFESCSPEQDTIDRIAQLPQLRELSFEDCNLLQLNLDQLAERENPIESLEIVHCPMTAGQIEAISRMSRLKRLGISDPDLLDQLVPLKELDQLDLRTCRGLEITQLLALEMPKLKRYSFPAKRASSAGRVYRMRPSFHCWTRCQSKSQRSTGKWSNS